MKVFLDDERPTPEGWIVVHSANASARRKMLLGVESIRRHAARNER
jgi:hypothetical protein